MKERNSSQQRAMLFTGKWAAAPLLAAVIFASLFTGLLTGCPQKPKDAGGGNPAQVTITVTGDTHVTDVPKTFKTAKGSTWQTVKAKSEIADITFEANYKLKVWKLGSGTGKDLDDGYKFEADSTVFAVSKLEITPPAPKKYTITFGEDGSGGSLTAKRNGVNFISGTEADENSTIVFTAEPTDGYTVEGWTLDSAPLTAAGSGTTYNHTVTGTAVIKVKFKTSAVPPASGITVTVKGDEHVNVIKPGFTVPKGSLWGVILAEAVQSVSYKPGWELKCWHLNDAAGMVLDMYYSAAFDADTTIFAEAQEAAPKVDGGVSLFLSHEKPVIKITAKTSDGAAIAVDGAEPASIPSGMETSVTAKGGSRTITLNGKITELDVHGSNLISINVQGLQDLRILKCYENDLTTLNVQGLAALQILECGDNLLTSLNVQGLSLKELDCHGNLLTKLDLQGMPLTELLCYRNRLSLLNVQSCSKLKKVQCGGNQLTSLNLSGLEALTEADCNENELASLDVSGCTALEVLECYTGKLTSLSVAGLKKLETLYCAGNELNTLDISGCKSLVELDIQYNRLGEQAFIKIFTDLPKREIGDDGECILFSEADDPDFTEGNLKSFTSPDALAKAFNAAKGKHWIMKKTDADGQDADI